MQTLTAGSGKKKPIDSLARLDVWAGHNVHENLGARFQVFGLYHLASLQAASKPQAVQAASKQQAACMRREVRNCLERKDERGCLLRALRSRRSNRNCTAQRCESVQAVSTTRATVTKLLRQGTCCFDRHEQKSGMPHYLRHILLRVQLLEPAGMLFQTC